jgi:hypothetical protein
MGRCWGVYKSFSSTLLLSFITPQTSKDLGLCSPLPLVKNRGDKRHMVPKLLVVRIMLRRIAWQWLYYISLSPQDTGAMYESDAAQSLRFFINCGLKIRSCRNRVRQPSMSLSLPLVENSLRSSPMISENGLLPIRCCEAPQSCLSLSISQYVGCSREYINSTREEYFSFLSLQSQHLFQRTMGGFHVFVSLPSSSKTTFRRTLCSPKTAHYSSMLRSTVFSHTASLPMRHGRIGGYKSTYRYAMLFFSITSKPSLSCNGATRGLERGGTALN